VFGKLEERGQLKYLGIVGENIRWNTVIGWEALDWIHLTQDRDQCHYLVNTVVNLQVS
jgi:hypothetical protein